MDSRPRTSLDDSSSSLGRVTPSAARPPNVIPVPGVNTSRDERVPRMAADGLSTFAMTSSPTVSGVHIALATRTNAAVAFTSLQLVANVNNAPNSVDPYLFPGGDVMYLGSDLAGNLGLYRSAKVNGTFSSPTLERRDTWTKIRLSGGMAGWMPAGAVERVAR